MKQFYALAVLALFGAVLPGQSEGFKVVGFATAINDLGHLSFVREAQTYFPQQAAKHGFTWQYTTDWNNLNDNFLASVDVVIFLDTRPENSNQRAAFERYMRNGGAWIGFHFSAFALSPSDYPNNWNWYHYDFLGSGQYMSNTWAPTSAVLRVETYDHPATWQLPRTFTCEPNEWYRWENDLRSNPSIQILLAIDEASFPLGTNPPETWYSGYYPVVWANRNYKMVYINMGHNVIDYANGNADLSHTFANEVQNRMVVDSILWMGNGSNNCTCRCGA
jgi:hypothetical protein